MDRESLGKLKQKWHPLLKCILCVLFTSCSSKHSFPVLSLCTRYTSPGDTAEPIRLSQLWNCYCGRAVPIYHLADQSYRCPDTPSIPSADEPPSYLQEKHSTLWAHMRIPQVGRSNFSDKDHWTARLLLLAIGSHWSNTFSFRNLEAVWCSMVASIF